MSQKGDLFTCVLSHCRIFISLLSNTTACLMFWACTSPRQLPFQKGQDWHDCILFEQIPLLCFLQAKHLQNTESYWWMMTKDKTIWMYLSSPRLGTLPVPGSGVSGDVVSAPSSTSWIWDGDRKKDSDRHLVVSKKTSQAFTGNYLIRRQSWHSGSYRTKLACLFMFAQI